LALADALGQLEREAVHGTCDTGRYRCPYYSWGSGPPLLFIPGLSDDALSFVMPIALLSRHFRCVAYDLPTGRADGARLGRYRHADYVADVFALLDHLGARRSYLLGASFGSTIALAALRAAPERLPRGILVCGFAHRRLAPAELLLARLARYWPGPACRLPFRGSLLRRTHFGPFAGRGPEVWDYFLRRWGSPPLAAVARRAAVLHGVDLRPVLPEIRQPVLLICGEGDPLVSPSCEEELLRGLPRAGRVELSRCGHVPQFTHPEVLAEVVRRFLTPPDADPAKGG
jgi:pimeloyl-ACP methyl ester carboxylesterase